MATIYQPVHLYPDGVSIDATDDNTFSCIVNGNRVTGYLLRIYDNSDNSLIYTDTTSFGSGDYLYNNDTLEIVVPNTSGCINGNEYNWNIVYYNVSEQVASNFVLFKAEATPTLSISVPATVTTQSYEFVGTYSQSNNVSVYYWYYELYDSNENLIIKTNKVYSPNIKHTFDGFVAGETYQIKAFVENQDGVKISTELYSFDVSYTPSEFILTPSVTIDESKAAPLIEVYNAVSVLGSVTGTFSYEPDLFVEGNFGINIDSASELEYNIDVPDGSTLRMYAVLTSEFEGEILRASDDDGNFISVGYLKNPDISISPEPEVFYLREYSAPPTESNVYYPTEEFYLLSDKVYLIVIKIGTAVTLSVIEDVHIDVQFITNDMLELFDSDEDFFFTQEE